MAMNPRFTMIALTTLMLATAGCATQSDLEAYATKNDLAALRSELMTEIQKAQESAQRAEQNASAAAEASQKSAADAAAASEKADAIFRQSLRK